jgi:hypothetical protein
MDPLGMAAGTFDFVGLSLGVYGTHRIRSRTSEFRGVWHAPHTKPNITTQQFQILIEMKKGLHNFPENVKVKGQMPYSSQYVSDGTQHFLPQKS